ncbi:MAG TPA: chloride channel protein [Bacteroidales bacterium]|nr:chloride channel protein [Bacteroidales bacterium]HRS17998.1 chloride channel protein [Bacteroidales bacterium]
MKVSKYTFLVKFIRWRMQHVTDKQFVYFLSIIIGLIVGIAAVLLKLLVHAIRHLVHIWSPFHEGNFLYFFLPMVGIAAAVLFMKYVIKHNVKHGVPSVLYAISMEQGKLKPHQTFSSIVTSALTVGFGGSVGLEGPSIVTGAAIGSNVGRILRLKYKHIILLIGCGSAGVMAAIFNAPVAALVFALEVIVLNLAMSSIVPLLLASSAATLTSYFFLEQDVLFHAVELFNKGYELLDIPSFIVLGIFTGLVSVYFKRMYIAIESKFEHIERRKHKLYIGGGLLGLLLFFFPSLYGEGYDFINMAFRGDYSFLFANSIFIIFEKSFLLTCVLFCAVIFIKVIASSLTFGAGGVGGIFAPSLFIGANIGLFFWYVFEHFQIDAPVTIFVLLGMCGTIAGVLHAPLTGIFLIADITSGYSLFVPLMIVSAVSFATVRIFENNSVYTYLLAKRKQLITHNKDQSVLTLLQIKKLIETNFSTVHVNATLGDLIEVIKYSKRNIFPVVDDDGMLHGIVKLDDIRHIMFSPEKYNKIDVRTVMHMPKYYFSPTDDMDDVVAVIQKSGHYNFPILDNGKYVGFISRATVFSEYRKISEFFSEE